MDTDGGGGWGLQGKWTLTTEGDVAGDRGGSVGVCEAPRSGVLPVRIPTVVVAPVTV